MDHVDAEPFLGDGLVSQDEYVFGTYKVQKVVQTAGSDSQALMRRKSTTYPCFLSLTNKKLNRRLP